MSLMMIKPKKYSKYPVFSYLEAYRLIDRFESILESVACAKDPQTTFADSKISVKDILDVKAIVSEELSWSMDKKLNAIWCAEEGELFPDSDALAKKQHGNPHIKEITKPDSKEHCIEAFKEATEWAKKGKRELEAINETPQLADESPMTDWPDVEDDME